MKTLNKIFLMLIIPITFIHSQVGTAFDAPFAIGGGFTPGWIFPKMDPINEKVKAFGVPELSNGFFGTGGSGYIYLGVIPYLRIGGMGFGGSTSESAIVDGYKREVKYSSGFGGFTVEYTLPFIHNIGVSIGGIIGGGSNKLEIYRNKNNFSWDDTWNESSDTSSSNKNFSRTLKLNFFSLTPTVNIDIPIYRFFALRIGAGYTFAFNDNWKADNDMDLMNTPSDLKGDSFFFQTGIYIGFFQF